MNQNIIYIHTYVYIYMCIVYTQFFMCIIYNYLHIMCLKQCHFYHPWLGMVYIQYTTHKHCDFGGCFMTLFYPHYMILYTYDVHTTYSLPRILRRHNQLGQRGRQRDSIQLVGKRRIHGKHLRGLGEGIPKKTHSWKERRVSPWENVVGVPLTNGNAHALWIRWHQIHGIGSPWLMGLVWE